jgi:hypothetical protein
MKSMQDSDGFCNGNSSAAAKEHRPFHPIRVLWPRPRGCETRVRSSQLDNRENCVGKRAQGYRTCCKESLGLPTSSFRQIAGKMYAGIAKFPSGSSVPVALLACASSVTKELCSWPVKHRQRVKCVLFRPPTILVLLLQANSNIALQTA